MSLYQLQKFLYQLNRDDGVKEAFRSDPGAALAGYELSDEEAGALQAGDIGLLYVLGVNGQIKLIEIGSKDCYVVILRHGYL